MSNKCNVRSYHPTHILAKRQRKNDIDLNDYDIFYETRCYLEDLAQSQPNCCCKTGTGTNRLLSCSCLTIFSNASVACAVACFVIQFGKKKMLEKQQQISEWIRYAIADKRKGEPCRYLIPFSSFDEYIDVLAKEGIYEIPYDILKSHKVCQSALMTILGIGRVAWKKSKEGTYEGFAEHGLKGKPSNGRSRLRKLSLYDDFELFFQELELSVEQNKYNGKAAMELSPMWSQRKLFQSFCWNRGYDVVCRSNGATTTKKRTDYAWLNSGLEYKPICSVQTFINYWKENYPQLSIK